MNRKQSLWSIRQPVPRGTALALAFIMPVLVLGAWCVVSYGHLAPPDFVPSPTEVVRGTLQLFLQYDLATAILVSTKRIVLSFLLAAAVALPLGILMGAFAPVHHLFESIMAPLRYMPISAFIPLLILWFGIFEKEKIAFLFLGTFVYLLPVVVTAIRAVPEELIQTALTLGATRAQVVRTVLIPQALPEIFDSFRVMNAIAWTYVILAEAVNLEVPDKPGVGEIIVLLGPSGCGKSTILKCVAGLLRPTRGKVLVSGEPVDGVGRDRGMVFQQYTSFGWLTIRQNVEYGLRIAGVPSSDRTAEVDKYLHLVGLHEFANEYPKSLSGGMKQRVAIARTLINHPKLVLMDEPFGALDPQTRWEMQTTILDIARKEDNTIVLVTHDVSEAVYVADTCYVMAPRPTKV